MTAYHSPSETFYSAAGYLANAPSLSKLSSKTKLELYGLYKYLTVSPKPTVGRRPPLFDIAGRAKWDAWTSTYKSYGDRYVEAENRYLLVARQLGWTENTALPSSSQKDTKTGDLDDDDDDGSGSSGEHWGIGNAVSSVPAPPTEEEPTSIHGLALANNVDGLKSFLQETPNTDLNQCDEFGYTPLHLAADRGSAAVVELLLRRGADPNLKDPDGLTALELAQVAGYTEVQELLDERTFQT